MDCEARLGRIAQEVGDTSLPLPLTAPTSPPPASLADPSPAPRSGGGDTRQARMDCEAHHGQIAQEIGDSSPLPISLSAPISPPPTSVAGPCCAGGGGGEAGMDCEARLGRIAQEFGRHFPPPTSLPCLMDRPHPLPPPAPYHHALGGGGRTTSWKRLRSPPWLNSPGIWGTFRAPTPPPATSSPGLVVIFPPQFPNLDPTHHSWGQQAQRDH